MATWTVTWRDYSSHHLGRPPPPMRQRRFSSLEAAAAELARLRADAGPDLVAGLVETRAKFAAEQGDFGFPINHERRLTT